VRIPLLDPPSKGSKVTVKIEYKTSPNSTAIQWLEPRFFVLVFLSSCSQTAGKIHPYLFTQCQAIHARSLLPCQVFVRWKRLFNHLQDAPSVKTPYSASITVPESLTAVMSAVSTSHSDVHDGKRTFHFEQKIPTSVIISHSLIYRSVLFDCLGDRYEIVDRKLIQIRCSWVSWNRSKNPSLVWEIHGWSWSLRICWNWTILAGLKINFHSNFRLPRILWVPTFGEGTISCYCRPLFLTEVDKLFFTRNHHFRNGESLSHFCDSNSYLWSLYLISPIQSLPEIARMLML
jgi:hypothetical protein